MSRLKIHRYIIWEISIPCLLSLLIFSFVLLMGRIPRLTELVINKGVPLGEIIKLFSYLLPTFLSLTVPLSFLLGILLAFGRLSADSEFIAMKASGISLYSLLRPVLLLALICSLVTGWLSVSVRPASKTAFRSSLFEIATSKASVGIQAGIFNDDFDGIVLYSGEIDDRTGIMKNVFISDERQTSAPATIVANQGQLIPDPENFSMTLRLNQGSIHRRPPRAEEADYQIVGFNSYQLNIDMSSSLAPGQTRNRSRSELSWSELSTAITIERDLRNKRRLEVEKHKRITIAFAPLVFAFVGIPLGLQSNRSGKGAGFAMSLAVALTYYVLQSLGSTLAARGLVQASLALWLPNICFLLGGGYFLHRTAIEQPLKIVQAPQRLIERLIKRKGR